MPPRAQHSDGELARVACGAALIVLGLVAAAALLAYAWHLWVLVRIELWG
jgi:hypothetical protein